MIPSDLGGTDYTYWLCAVGGTFFFLLRVAFVVLGGFGADDFGCADEGLTLDGPNEPDFSSTGDSDAAFRLLSLNSISAFVMMFGWVGLAASFEHKLSVFASLACAFSGGLLMMAATSYLFVLARKVACEGAEFQVEQVTGKIAKVYMRIPCGGKGKVHITVNGLLRELDAQSNLPEPIESFTSVLITGTLGPSLVIVSPIGDA